MRSPGKSIMPRVLWLVAATFLLAGLAVYVSRYIPARPNPLVPQSASGTRLETIPTGIVVSESSPGTAGAAQQPGGNSPGDRIITGYGSALTEAKQDLVLLSRALGNFLLMEKSASVRPLSANGEWAKALAGRRGGAGPWFSPSAPVWDSAGLLVDRWKRPLHFHALGGGMWKIRSVGPDGIPYSTDDLVERLPLE